MKKLLTFVVAAVLAVASCLGLAACAPKASKVKPYNGIKQVSYSEMMQNIVEYADALEVQGKGFSDEALYEISQLKKLLFELYDRAIHAYRDMDLNALREANEIEEQTDEFTRMMEENHIARLEKGICTPLTGAQYLSLSSNAERIADHLINVAKSIKAYI